MMEYIPLPDDIPQAHYFLEQLNTPGILTAIRVAVILLVVGLLVTYVTVISKSKRKPVRAAVSRMAMKPEDTVIPPTAVHREDETKTYAAAQPAMRRKPEPDEGTRLKKGLFGYSKQNVELCLQRMKDDFTQQMREKDQEILTLKEQLTQLQAENDMFSLRQAEISSALISAKLYSNQLREEAQEKQRQEIMETRARYDAARGQIKELEGGILMIQQLFIQLMDKMGHASQKYLTQCGELASELEKVQQDTVLPDGEQAENQSA